MELICFPMAGRNVNLVEIIGDKYMMFGVLLLEDDTGNRITAFDDEFKCNAEKINFRVLKLWVEGKGRLPVTWATLVTVLKDIGLVRLAKDIEARIMNS